MMEKKAKVRTALAASAMTVSGLVLDHWLARTQKQMNHRKVHKPVACSKQGNKNKLKINI